VPNGSSLPAKSALRSLFHEEQSKSSFCIP